MNLRHDSAGATIVEATFVIGVFLSAIFAVIDFGYLLMIQNATNRAATEIVNSAKTLPPLLSEDRPAFAGNSPQVPTPGCPNGTNSITCFLSGRATAIQAGLNVISSVAGLSSSSSMPRLHSFDTNIGGTDQRLDAALLFPGQTVTLYNLDGTKQADFSYVRLDEMGQTVLVNGQSVNCNDPGTPAQCQCDSKSCPGLVYPGEAGPLAEYRNNPPEAIVVVSTQLLIPFPFLPTSFQIVGRAYASPERTTFTKNPPVATKTCGQFPNGRQLWCGTCIAGAGQSSVACVMASANTPTINGEGCGSCQPVTCKQMLGGNLYQGNTNVEGFGWFTVIQNITNACLTLSAGGVPADPNTWSQYSTYCDLPDTTFASDGNLNNWSAWAPGADFSKDYQTCVQGCCHPPQTCEQVYSSLSLAQANAAAPCPQGQQRAQDVYGNPIMPTAFDFKTPDEISVASCTYCTGATNCTANTPVPPNCDQPVLQPSRMTDDPNSCYTCNGKCEDHTNQSAACGTCNSWETCSYAGSASYTGTPSDCCTHTPMDCANWSGAGTCDPAQKPNPDAICFFSGTAPNCNVQWACPDPGSCPYGWNPSTCVCNCPACPSGTMQTGVGTCTCTTCTQNPDCPVADQFNNGNGTICCLSPS